MKFCAGKSTRNKRCRNPVEPGSDYCAWHMPGDEGEDPSLTPELKQELSDLRGYARGILSGLAKGNLNPHAREQLPAVAQMLNASVRAIELEGRPGPDTDEARAEAHKILHAEKG